MTTTSKNSPGIILALTAIVIWSTLALISTRLTHISPFLILGIAFLISGLVSLVRPRAWKIPLTTLLVGVAGIFGYHLLYFKAFSLAPAVEANLINYLWPLLIVVLSPAIIPGYRLTAKHITAALLGLTGAALIVTEGRLNIQTVYLPGYLLALGAAVTWAVYSLLTKRLPPFGTDSVGVFCLLSGLLSLFIFFLSGGTISNIQNLSLTDWLLITIAGVGPLGAAFYYWDAALKRSDPRILGSLAYLTPMLSTVNLLLFAGKNLTLVSVAAMILIIGEAVLGSLGTLKA
jgi:drug/metabolite transporter (DMT)-like permease